MKPDFYSYSSIANIIKICNLFISNCIYSLQNKFMCFLHYNFFCVCYQMIFDFTSLCADTVKYFCIYYQIFQVFYHFTAHCEKCVVFAVVWYKTTFFIFRFQWEVWVTTPHCESNCDLLFHEYFLQYRLGPQPSTNAMLLRYFDQLSTKRTQVSS